MSRGAQLRSTRQRLQAAQAAAAVAEQRLRAAEQERDALRDEVRRLRESVENLDALYCGMGDRLREADAEIEALQLVHLALQQVRQRLQQLSDSVPEHVYQELMSLLDDEPLDEQGRRFDALRAVAERQREACARHFLEGSREREWCMTTPLVTETKP